MTSCRRFSSLVFALACVVPLSAQSPGPRPSVYQTTLEEPGQLTPEITTVELQAILATGAMPVFDVRTAEEYAIAHIPGSINVFELEVQRITELVPDRSAPIVLYCNGPSCGKSKRTSEQLVALGYTNVRRYQLGLPVWRALSLTVQTDLPGLDYIYTRDHTSVFVDARTPAEFTAGSIPGAVNIQAGEATAANDDGRLPFRDKGTRVVVFGNTAAQARGVAAEIAKKAYWNSSFFGGTLTNLIAGGYINHPPVAVTRDVTVAAGEACTANVTAAHVDGGSYDIDAGNTLTLSIDAAAPLGLGQHAVTLTATDNRGASSSAITTVTVADQTPPSIENLAVERNRDAPDTAPSHGMKLFTVAYELADNCGGASAQLGVTTEGHRAGAFQIVDAHHVLLRAGDDVSYRVVVSATDDAGNRSTRTLAVARD